ncbi:DUF2268 domain-containing putative Zn-dependent protease, partial [Lactococcus garvieae]|uniref:DUF2268 domain-containing putative Zn-dependent protease n=1 Tax=Lactococcus garvieae TaxID=1363 RepID=UPI001BD1BB9A
YAAPWTKYYTDSWKEEWYPRFIEKRLSQKGRRFYKDVLYGKESMGIPKMLGYYYGYMICLKAAERLNKQTLALMQMPAETILKTALEK